MKGQSKCTLIGTEELRIVTTENNVEKEVRYELKTISKSELEDLRESGKPVFILKKYNKYYYTEVTVKFNLFNNKLCNHLCKSCKNCRPSKCQKVRDIGDDKKIEKYDYLAIGVETDNMKDYYDSFVVKACIGFIPY